MFDLDTSLGSLFSLGWQAAWKAAANDTSAFERLKNDADWHAEQVRAHVAQLEARQWQPAKWEDLRAGQGVLVWKYGLWLGGRYDATYDEVDFGEGFTASAREPLLVMPPAPDGDA